MTDNIIAQKEKQKTNNKITQKEKQKTEKKKIRRFDLMMLISAVMCANHYATAIWILKW
jgi:hypothetical protein